MRALAIRSHVASSQRARVVRARLQVWEGDWAGVRVVVKVLREQEALRSFLSEVNIWRVRARAANAPLVTAAHLVHAQHMRSTCTCT